MKDNSAHSYDLKHAQQILTRLLPVPTPQPKILPEGEQEFLRLSRETLPMVEPRLKSIQDIPPAGADPEEKLSLPPRFTSWEDCLSWCMEVTRSEAAFVVDSQGFIIASRGRIPGRGFECTGAELVCSVEQLEKMDADAGKLIWVDLDFDRRRIVGFVTPTENEEYFIVGLLSPAPVNYSHKQAITRQIIESLPTID